MHGADADIFTANMYLAEDRVSCPVFKLGLILMNRGRSYVGNWSRN
jgi:hypothetical protein